MFRVKVIFKANENKTVHGGGGTDTGLWQREIRRFTRNENGTRELITFENEAIDADL